MSATRKQRQIFEKGSRTYFTASQFFPQNIRDDVTTLYAFVRQADDFVDNVPADMEGFLNFEIEWQNHFHNKKVQDPIVREFVKMAGKYAIKKEWVDAFLAATKSDLCHKKCTSMQDTLSYVYGSAEVIGLMLCRIFGVDEKNYMGAQILGRSMQYANFLRDVDEDNQLGRQYIPLSIINRYGFKTLTKNECQKKKKNYCKLMRAEIDRYREWRKQAQKAIQALPFSVRVPVRLADSMYNWTTQQIYKSPLIVFDKKVKPAKWFILLTGLKYYLLGLIKLA